MYRWAGGAVALTWQPTVKWKSIFYILSILSFRNVTPDSVRLSSLYEIFISNFVHDKIEIYFLSVFLYLTTNLHAFSIIARVNYYFVLKFDL